MGVGGVAFSPKLSDISNAIRAHYGVLSEVAKQFNVQRSVIYDYIKLHPELNELIKEMREHYVELMCDRAENKLMQLIAQDDEQSVAFKALQFALNNQGRKRNYNHPEVEAMTKALGVLDKVKHTQVLPPNDNTAK